MQNNNKKKQNTTQVWIDSNTQLGIDTTKYTTTNNILLNIEIPSAPQSVQQYGGNLSGDVQTRRVKQTSWNFLPRTSWSQFVSLAAFSTNYFFTSARCWATHIYSDRRWPMSKREKKKTRRLVCHKMYNLLVRRAVFPVSVVSRCPRQIAEWKGWEPSAGAVRHVVARCYLRLPDRKQVYSYSPSCWILKLLHPHPLPDPVGWRVGWRRAILCLRVCVIFHRLRVFPHSGATKGRFMARWGREWLCVAARRPPLGNWQPASPRSAGTGRQGWQADAFIK